MGISKEIDKVNHISHSFHYDSLGRVVRHDSTQGLKSHVVYDKMNRISQYSYSIPGESLNTTYHYDNKNQLFMGQTNSKFTTKNEYDELNRLIDEEFHMDDLTASYSFRYYRRGMGGNKTSHLTYMLSFSANNQARVTQYQYYDNGNLASITDHSDYGGARTYQYDGTNQMITERIGDNSITYTYDAGGNITSKTEKGITTTWLYEDEQWSDLLTSYDGQTITYDEIGNPLTYRDGMSFAWEKGRQLKQVTKEDEITSYQYNSSGLRTQKVSSKYGTTTFMLEGSLILSSTSENETIYFYYNEKNQAVAMRINDETYVYERNLQGDIVGLLDKTGTWVAKYSYNAWGEPIYITDNKGHDISGDRTHVANKNPYRYRGYYYDVETGFYYLKTRYYDPITCRFINQDNLLGANKDVYCYNLFAYCSNNPTNLTDPNGTFAGAIFGLIYAAATVVTTAVTSYAFGQSKPNTGITCEDVGNAIWNTIVFIVDPVGSTIRALNPPAVQEARKKEIVRPKIEVLPREFIKDSTFPSLKRPTFPYNPDMFHPSEVW